MNREERSGTAGGHDETAERARDDAWRVRARGWLAGFAYITTMHERLGRRAVMRGLRAIAAQGKGETFMDALVEFEREGRRAGRAQMLLEQLSARFGRIPTATRAGIETASEARLVRWALRVLTEPTLAAVLEGSTVTMEATSPAKKTAKKAPARKRTRAVRE
ncbi:MAG: hypothetical protein QM820_30200 [Minicystis sp.]